MVQPLLSEPDKYCDSGLRLQLIHEVTLLTTQGAKDHEVVYEVLKTSAAFEHLCCFVADGIEGKPITLVELVDILAGMHCDLLHFYK